MPKFLQIEIDEVHHPSNNGRWINIDMIKEIWFWKGDYKITMIDNSIIEFQDCDVPIDDCWFERIDFQDLHKDETIHWLKNDVHYLKNQLELERQKNKEKDK